MRQSTKGRGGLRIGRTNRGRFDRDVLEALKDRFHFIQPAISCHLMRTDARALRAGYWLARVCRCLVGLNVIVIIRSAQRDIAD